jgi:uncharacterized membrane protein YphA (DoxX/SURF4 family)
LNPSQIIEKTSVIARSAQSSLRRGMVIDILFKGVGWTDVALTLDRVAVGMFFMFSGYHKLFKAQRHHAPVDELTALHVAAVRINQWWVPSVEFAAGSLHRPPYAPRRVRPACDRPRRQRHVGRVRIKSYQPIDKADRIDNWLYLPEILYAFMLIIFVSAGAGPYSLDAAILRLGVQ